MTTDTDLIRLGIAQAKNEQREIDNKTAKLIASQYHDGSTLTLGFVSTGWVPKSTETESFGGLWSALFSEWATMPSEDKEWANWFGTYLVHREDRECKVAGWVQL